MVRPGLDVDLRHHLVAHDPRDQADEPVAGGGLDDRPGLVVLTRAGQLLGETGEVGAVDDLGGSFGRGGQPARSAQAAYGVVAHAQQLGCMLDR